MAEQSAAVGARAVTRIAVAFGAHKRCSRDGPQGLGYTASNPQAIANSA
jgi:hypothetical protein